MNVYFKYQPNVFLAKCSEKHEKGSVIPVQTKYGKENDSIVFNLIFEKDGFYYYSIIRADGFNVQEWAKRRADKLRASAARSHAKSEAYYKASNKDSDFLSLGEPIKIGHHSEKRHRKIIEQAHRNIGNSIGAKEKAENQESRAEFWANKAATINLSMPESLEYYEFKLEEAKKRHEGLKNGTIERSHSFSLTYAKKEVNELEAKLKLAQRLWN